MKQMQSTRFVVLLLTTLFALSHSLSVSWHRKRFLGAPPNRNKYALPPDQWFEQKLDHFNPSDTTTWQQRYFTNDTFSREGGPVFLMIGGEGEASPAWMVEGNWITLAQKHGALCFQLEHRFYGKSHPTKDMSVKNLRYLNSQQALADLAYFTQVMNVKNGLTDKKWVAFGGSYPGALAAWYRLKYPHLVHASIATSGPIFATVNFKEYLGVVRDSIDSVNPQCNAAIKEAVHELDKLIENPAGWTTINEIFKLCDPLDASKANDVANLYETLAGNFEGVVQYNRDNRAFEGAKGTTITIDVLCDIMTDDTKYPTPLFRYAAVNDLILKTYDQKCLDFKYNSMIKSMQSVSWNSSASEGGRQWMFQTCIEFGYYQSSDLDDQPFGKRFPVDFFVQQCAAIFGPKYNLSLLKQGVNWTNNFYGGYNLNVTRVVFPNGSFDPWHALSFTKNVSEEAPAIYIEGTAHCANMYPSTPEDPPQLVAAREKIDQLITKWLQA